MRSIRFAINSFQDKTAFSCHADSDSSQACLPRVVCRKPKFRVFWTTTTHRVVQCKSPVASVEFAHFKTPENKLPMMRLAERMKLISFSSPGSDLDAEFSTAQSTSCPKRTSKCHLGIIALCTYDVLERKNSTESSRGSAKIVLKKS